jgi:hypothetical protein
MQETSMSHRSEIDVLIDQIEDAHDAELYATWQTEHEWKLRWKMLAKHYRQQLQELRGRLRDVEARRGR